MNGPNLCTDRQRPLSDHETNCSVMRSVYTHSGWAFNVVWFHPDLASFHGGGGHGSCGF